MEPMRIAVIADIHSNLAALEAVLAHFKGVDEVWCLGDIVGYGPWPNECVEVVRNCAAVCVAGNHDWAALGRISTSDFNPEAAAAAQWTARQLTAGSKAFLENLPLREEKGDFTIVHGSPRDPIWEYVLYASTAEIGMHYLRTSYCLVGHSHFPLIFFCFQEGDSFSCRSVEPTPDVAIQLGQERAVINPGSVGQPRDGIPDARYITIDIDGGRVQLRYHRVPYDIELTQRKMEEAGLPRRLWMRLSYGW